MVADIEIIERALQRFHEFGVAVAEIVGAAIEVEVDQPAPAHIVEAVALAPIDDEVDAGLLPELGLVRIPVADGLVEQLLLRLELEVAIVEHRLLLQSSID